jgi:hypothetical protein
MSPRRTDQQPTVDRLVAPHSQHVDLAPQARRAFIEERCALSACYCRGVPMKHVADLIGGTGESVERSARVPVAQGSYE